MLPLFKKVMSVVIVVSFTFSPVSVYALPQNGTVVGGNADPFNYSGNTLTIKQNTNRLATNWESFSIGNPETVTFNQPNSSSIALNRVTGVNPSNILGKLSANGRVMLINPNGIVFGVNSTVDVAGLVASSLDVDVSDFMAEKNDFTFSGVGGSVLNYGKISLRDPGGYVALLGSMVKNVGLIEANLSKVILAAGEQMKLDLDPSGVIGVAVDITKGTTRTGEYTAVNNAGKIVANGGKVILTAKVLDNVLKSAVNNDGIIEANTMNRTDGQVLLKSNQDIELNGTIIASGAIDALADENVFIGKPLEDIVLSTYEWTYLGEVTRYYYFKEFGYYYDGGTLRVVLSKGFDIGRDPNSPTSGFGIQELPGMPLGLYTKFDPRIGGQLYTFFEDPALNPDKMNHVNIKGTEYWWEDMMNQGDRDFNDAIIDFRESYTTVKAPGALLDAPNIFLTARNGEIKQFGGDIYAGNLMMESNTGVSGTGGNGGILTHADNVSALNKSSGHIRISNRGDLIVNNLSSVNGLNTGVTGYNGIWNSAIGGEVNIEVKHGSGDDLDVNAPVDSFGPVIFNAEGDIEHTALGDVTIHNPYLLPNPPTNLRSPSHLINFPYKNDGNTKVDVVWGLPDSIPGYGFLGNAGGVYNMAPGSKIETRGGNANITANGNISLALVDAQNGNAVITSQNGSILDADLGVAPVDYDVIAHNIKLSAPNGSVGVASPGEIDLGHPYEFSYLWDNASNSTPDLLIDPYTTSFDPVTGDWSFATTSPVLSDGSWWIHVVTLDKLLGQTLPTVKSQQISNIVAPQTVASAPAHLGPFILYTPDPDNPEFWEAIEKEFRVYYEILNPSQFLGFEPAQKIGLYAYHPLVSADFTAFDDIQLDAGAYDFINGNLEMKKKDTAPYFGL